MRSCSALSRCAPAQARGYRPQPGKTGVKERWGHPPIEFGFAEPSTIDPDTLYRLVVAAVRKQRVKRGKSIRYTNYE